MGKWKKVIFKNLVNEQPKSKIKVESADNSGDFPFFTSGEKVFTHSLSLVKGENLYLATGGKANIKFFKGEAAYSTDTYVLTSVSEKIKYLFYCLQSQIDRIDSKLFLGSGLKHLQKKDLAKEVIVLPKNIKEQEKIAEVLGEVDKAIDSTKKLIDKYTLIKEGMLQDLLTNGIDENGKIRSEATHKYKDSPLGRIPVEWECVSLKEFVNDNGDEIVAGPFGSDLKVSDYTAEGVPLIRLQNIDDNRFINKDIIYISNLKAKELIRHQYRIGDIVLAKLGIPIGKTAIIPNDFENGVVVADVVRIRPNDSIFDKYFLMFMLNYDFARRQLNAERIGSTRPRVNISQLKKIYLKKPYLSEQNEISKIINQLQTTIINEQQYLSKLKLQKQALMQDLLTNKVSVDCLL